MNVNMNRLTKILTLNVSSGWYFVKDNKHFFNFFKKNKTKSSFKMSNKYHDIKLKTYKGKI